MGGVRSQVHDGYCRGEQVTETAQSRTEVPGESGMMSTLWPDTHLEIERLQVERLRQMPSWRKVALMA